MGLTQADYIRMSKDPKFMAARWKQRVAIGQKRLDSKVGSLKGKELENELYMQQARIRKMKAAEKKAKR